jgi:hypothetical protein
MLESRDPSAPAGVAARVRAPLVRLGRGHPLALALLADAARTGPVPQRLADVPDLISALLESLLRDAPSDAHVVGLATCAKAWLTTEDLLRETVSADAPAVFAWLRRRPFVVSRPRGLTPHDLTRDVLDAEFERRSPAARLARVGGVRDACATTDHRDWPTAILPSRSRTSAPAGGGTCARRSRPAHGGRHRYHVTLNHRLNAAAFRAAGRVGVGAGSVSGRPRRYPRPVFGGAFGPLGGPT